MDRDSWIEHRIAPGPNRPAITSDGRTQTYGESFDRIESLAAELRPAASGAAIGSATGTQPPRFPG